MKRHLRRAGADRDVKRRSSVSALGGVFLLAACAGDIGGSDKAMQGEGGAGGQGTTPGVGGTGGSDPQKSGGQGGSARVGGQAGTSATVDAGVGPRDTKAAADTKMIPSDDPPRDHVPTIVAVGWNGWRIRSRDLGRTWTDRIRITENETYDKGNLFRGVTWGAGKFVAVGEYISVSPDGATWTTANTPPKIVKTSGTWGYLSSVAYGNGTFVGAGGVARWFNPGNPVMVSTDGMNWTWGAATCGDCAVDDNPSSVVFADGRFVLVFGSGKAFSSTDAKVWAPFSGFSGGAITYCNGALKAPAQCLPFKGHGVHIRWSNFPGITLQWSLDGAKWNVGYTETKTGPYLWHEQAQWLAFGYAPP